MLPIIKLYISDIMKAEFTISQEHVRLSVKHPIRVAEVSNIGDSILAHDHEFYEVVLIHAGSGIHQTTSGERTLEAGDLLILAPGQIHGIREARNLELFNAYYLSEWLLQGLPLRDEAPDLYLFFLGRNLFPDKALVEPVHVSLPPHCAQLVEHELRFLESMSDHKSPNTVLMRASLVKAFAMIADVLVDEVSLERRFLSHPIVTHAMDCIDRALEDGEACNVALWSEKMRYTPDHFSRRFRELTGETPTSFFQRRRIQSAAHALIRGNEPINEIAHRLGYSDNAHFSRMFRSRFMMSPNAYRKRFK